MGKQSKKHNSSFKQKKTSERYQEAKINGIPNPKYVDLLDEDKAISGQSFACISFISPEKIIKQKEIFYFEQFLKQWDINRSMDKFIEFLHFTAYKHNIDFDELTADFTEFVTEEKAKIHQSDIESEFKTYVDKHGDDLQQKFNKHYSFQTSTRGIKIRGTFPSQEEAELRCKILREMDPNHEIYVGPVGIWMPWHPESYKTGRVEHMENELNHLMHEKNKNDESAKIEFEKHVIENKKKAIAENKQNAEKYGSTISQTLDENNNLVSINSINTQERDLVAKSALSSRSIHDELFEGDNVVMEQSDGGVSRAKKEKERLLRESLAIKEGNEDINEEEEAERKMNDVD